jgi:hypothetical protein
MQLFIITAPFLPVFRIREFWAWIRIIGSVPKTGSGYAQILIGFLHKSYLFGGIEMQENSKMYLTLSKSSRYFATFCEVS